jgi:hypothetical protein
MFSNQMVFQVFLLKMKINVNWRGAQSPELVVASIGLQSNDWSVYG